MTPKNFLFLLLLVIVSLNFSCQNSKKVKIGFLFPNLVSGRYQKEKVYFSEKIQQLGGEVSISNADYNDQLQIQQGKELIDKGVKVLVVNSLNLNTAAAIVRYAHDNGAKVIAYDRLIKNSDLDYFLTFDNEKVGTLIGDYITKLKPSGNYILLGGDKADQNAIWVRNGVMKALNPFLGKESIKVKYDIYVEDWSGDNARNEIQKYLDLSNNAVPDAILSSYDGMTTSVVDLLKEYNLAGKVLITGQDAELEACQNIVKGYQTMTVYKSVKQLAYKAAELAIKIANNDKINDATRTVNNGQIEVPTIYLDPIAVDINNLKTTVIADGFQSESEVYKN